MLIVRDVFTAKPGQASKLATVFKNAFGSDPSVKIMTDLVSDFNTVIMEHQVKDLSEYEELLTLYRAGKPGPNMKPDALEKMAGYTDLYVSGRREVLQVVP
jgi:hypothetical protein